MNELKEKISVENAKYLLSISVEELKDLIKRDDGDWNGESLYKDINVYTSLLKKWLKNSIPMMENKGFIISKYGYSKELVSCGRRYVKGFGVQKLTREVRGFLCNEYCVDLDMKNAHPTLLLNLLKEKFPDREFPLLKQYIDNRDDFLKEANTTKQNLITALFSSKSFKHHNQLFCKLDKELKMIQKLIYNKLDLSNYDSIITAKKNSLKQNKEGRFISCILCLEEDKVIKLVQENLDFKENIQTIIFDGFHFDKDNFTEEHIEKLNLITKHMNVKWVQKEFDNSIIKDESIEIDYDVVDTYENAKIKFEETHFIIENPFMFGRHYTVNGLPQYQFYQKEKFRDLVKPFQYFEPEIGKDCEFFSKWLGDDKRKSYKEVKFIPTHDDDPEIFNSFKGFEFEPDPEFEPDLEHEVIDIFKKHLNLLTNNDEDSVAYLFHYICHILQHPEQLPRVTIILKSKQGFGKDTLLDIIEHLIGKSFKILVGKR